MFGISLPEITIICIVLLLVVGPERMPEATKKAAHFFGKFRNQTDAMRRELYNTMYTPAKEISQDITKAKTSLMTVKSEITEEVRQASQQATDALDTPSEDYSST